MRTSRQAGAVVAAVLTALTVLAAPAPAHTFGPGPYRLADAEPQSSSSFPSGRSARIGSRILFAATTGSRGNELWISDGTPAGTRLLKDIVPGASSSYPQAFVAHRGRVYFSAYDSHGQEVWVTDGTSAGTRRVSAVRADDTAPNISEIVSAGDQLYFSADDGVHGRELWATDGTRAGTHLVLDIDPGDSYPRSLTPFGDRLVFGALDRLRRYRPFITDGTAAGTYLLDGGPGGLALETSYISTLGTTILFKAQDGRGQELWRSNGDPFSATLVKDINPGAASSSPTEIVRAGDTAYFAATTAAEGRELWSTDGTTAGTQLVRDIRAGADSSAVERLTAVDGTVYFTADDGTHGLELWSSTGQAATTRLVKDVNPGAAGSLPYELRAVGDHVTFTATEPVHGSELWVTDGTPEGTRLTADTVPGSGSSTSRSFGRLGATTLIDVTSGGKRGVWAYTTRASSTRVSPRSSYPRAHGLHRRITLTVRVSAAGATPTGRVSLTRAGRTVGRGWLEDGAARVRITTALGRGRHTLRATYSGSVNAQRSTSASFKVVVR